MSSSSDGGAYPPQPIRACTLWVRSPGGERLPIRELSVPPPLHRQLNLAVLLGELKELGEIHLGRRCYAGHLQVRAFDAVASCLRLEWVEETELTGELLAVFAEGSAGRELVQHAAELCCRAHGGQQRRDGMPYVLHPLEVALELQRVLVRPELTAAALLHDVVEDGHCPLGELQARFGPRVARLVDLVTVKEQHGPKGPEQDAAYLGELLADAEAALLKCADMSCNTRHLYLLADDALRRRLTGKYVPQVESWLLPWARAQGACRFGEQLALWLRSPLTLVDLHHHLQGRPMGGC
ncbi:MAG: bifunctional (p)ppGpp synthetase/guanosine-3',5'-bis(diphosphate) 3'-pyrophosphohydrolase [Deltaproteobacteria bacterium]|nr:bifunctional (p)ppGpp synthetase/guanosine-3',5'-bis(diphosphate) 3'-pyrophosphohydrolase [Deltaproteobacteria bacterium]